MWFFYWKCCSVELFYKRYYFPRFLFILRQQTSYCLIIFLSNSNRFFKTFFFRLPVDKTPPTPSVASLMSSPPRFTFPLAPPLFNPNNYSGGLLPIGGNRMVQPMPTTCLPPPHAGLLCPLPRPPLLLPSPIMQGILPTILPPAGDKY